MEWMLMPLKRYADFSGRSRRTEYWMWVLFQFLIGAAVMVIMFAFVGSAILSGDVGSAMAMGGIALIIYFLYALWSLVCLIPGLAVTVRRLHDTDRSGWWIMILFGPYLLMIVGTFMTASSVGSGGDGMMGAMLSMIAGLCVLVGGLVLLVFMVLEGTKGPNRFGPDPKGADSGQVFA